MLKLNQKTKMLIGVLAFFILTPLIVFYTLEGTGVFDTRSRASVPPAGIFDEFKPADLNLDLKVNLADYWLWLGYYRAYKENPSAPTDMVDVTKDGEVGLADFYEWIVLWRRFKIPCPYKNPWLADNGQPLLLPQGDSRCEPCATDPSIVALDPNCGEPPESLEAPATIEFSNITTTSITVTWSAVENARAYTLEWCKDTGCDFSTLVNKIENTTALSHVVTGLTANTVYRFRVKATYNDVHSPWKEGQETTAQTDTPTSEDLDLGTGADGDCNIETGTTNINSQSCVAGRSTGDAVNYTIATDVAAGDKSVTLSTAPGGIAVNDEILIINLQTATSSRVGDVGKYDTAYVKEKSGNTLTLKKIKNTETKEEDTSWAGLKNAYNASDSVMVQRIPQYKKVTIKGDSKMTANAYNRDNKKGGVIFFRATDVVTVNGTIDVSGLGYVGGVGGQNYDVRSFPGESLLYGTTNNGKGGISSEGAGGNGLWSGGGGGGKSGKNSGGAGGTGSTNAGAGGGGGGGNTSRYYRHYASTGGGGGGGGYGTGGIGGNRDLAAKDSKGRDVSGIRGANGTSSGSGAGGTGMLLYQDPGSCYECQYDGRNTGGGGGGGRIYGDANLTKLFFGSGGGGGGVQMSADKLTMYKGGTGGKGGGIVVIYAGTTNIGSSGSVISNGTRGGGRAGGGAGGSILIPRGISGTIAGVIVNGGAANTRGGAGGKGRVLAPVK